MGKKKPAVGATVPPPSQGEDFFSQLMNTFERGIVSAEIDLGGVMPKKEGGGSSVVTKLWGEAAPINTGPRGVHDQIFRRMKEIAATYGGKFTVHAPMDANPAGSTSLERLEAAEILKQSIEYADKLGGSVLTVHPIGPMGYYFIEPIVGTKMPVKNPFLLAANERELEDLFKKYNIKDELLKKQIKKEWENWVQTLPMNLAEKFGAQGKELLDQFSSLVALKKLVEIAENSKDRNELLSKIADMKANGYHDLVLEKITSRLNAILNNEGAVDKERLKRMKEYVEKLEKTGIFEREWARANLASIRPISPDGKVAYGKEEIELRKKAWEALMKKTERFGPFEDSIKSIKEHVKETFKSLLEDKEIQEILKKGKLKIALENLFPANPEKGYMQGVPYFYEPEHMAEIIKEIRSIAKAKGIPEDAITITFDVGHAAASGIKPSEFLERLKKEGIKPGHIHIVGGPGYGHAHIAWGDWLDEVSRMDPEIVKKLVDVGVINIEGGAGLHDIEVTLNALWNEGIPLEALLAMASAPDRVNPNLARYAGYQPPAYWEKAAYNLAKAGFPERAFYSFSNPTIGAPLRSSFYEFTIPAYSSGGIGFRNTPAVWHSSQPLLYSSKRR